MKNIITLSLIFISVSLSFGQKTYKTADKFFEKMQYIDAAKAYEAKIKKGDYSRELLQKAGDSYYFNTDMKGANKWYDILISDYLNEIDAEYIFRFAHTLQGIGDNKSATKWMKIFAKRAKQSDIRIVEYAQSKTTLNDILNIQPQFTLQNLSTNTKYSDFGPMYYNNRLVYSSAIDSSYYHTRVYNWNNQPFLNFYTGRINATETDVEFIEEFSETINTKYHEATLAFSPNQKKVYFTRNNFNKDLGRDDNGVNHLKLYSAELSDSLKGKREWTNIKELPFNSEDYSVGHPTVSLDGKKLYFVSDMPGAIGATDIFVVDILGEDNYSSPKNLGPTVNTSGREMFPYITNKSLYFASDGHLGLGGLDVFESSFTTETFQEPKNLGAPLNSELDDFGFIIKEEEAVGFVCSNRETGKGDDDIYSFQRLATNQATNEIKDQNCQQLVKGYVSNSKTGERIPDATIALYSDLGEKISQTQSKINGDYAFNYDLACNKKYQVKVEKIGYNPNEKLFVTSSISAETIVPLDIQTVDELIVEDNGLLKIKIGIIYFDLDKFFIRNDSSIELNKIVVLMTQYPKMVINIESHTDSRSPDDYNLELSNNRAQATRNYIISKGIAPNRITSALGYGETQLVNKCRNGVPCTEEEHRLNRRSEFIIVKM